MNTAKLITLGMLRGSGAAAAFSPLDIAGLELWLDASDSTTLFQVYTGTTPAAADGNPVGYWGDKSGSGNHVTQTSDAARPTLKLAYKNGLPALSFDGGDRLTRALGATLAQPTSVFIVLLFSVIGTTTRLAMDGVATNRNYLAVRTSGANYEIYAGASVYPGTPDTNWHALTIIYNGASSILRDNGIQQGGAINLGTQGADALSFGAGYTGGTPMTGYITEVLRYGAALSATEMAQVEAYLIGKWAP